MAIIVLKHKDVNWIVWEQAERVIDNRIIL